MEELINCNTQTIAKLLDGRNGCAVVSAADDVINCGLRHTADTAQLVNRDITLLTQLDNSLPDSLTYSHGYHLFLSKLIPICY